MDAFTGAWRSVYAHHKDQVEMLQARINTLEARLRERDRAVTDRDVVIRQLQTEREMLGRIGIEEGDQAQPPWEVASGRHHQGAPTSF